MEIRSLICLGRLSWALGRPKEAHDHFQAAIETATKIHSSDDAETCRKALRIYDLYSQAKADRLAGKADTAVRLLGQAAEIARQIGHPEPEIKCLRQMSMAFWESQNYQLFLSTNERILKLARESNDRRELAAVYQNFGLFHFQLKNYSPALDYYFQALEVSQSAGYRDLESMSLKNIGVMLLDLGFYERSLDFLERAAEIDRGLPGSVFMIQNLNNLGEAHRNMGLIFSRPEDLYRARDLFAETLEQAKRTGNRAIELMSFHNMGYLHLHLGRYHTALHFLEAASRLAEETADHEALARSTINMGICRLRLGDYARAEVDLERAKNRLFRANGASSFWEIFFHQGECEEAQGKPEFALPYYRASIQAIDDLRARISSDEYKAGFGREKLKVYEALAVLLYKGRNGRPSETDREIFEVVEKAKARAFLETLAAAAKENRGNSGTLSGNGTAIPRPAGFFEIQARLTNGRTAIIEYFLGEKQSFLFAVTEKRLSLWTLPPRKIVEKSVFAYLRLLSESPRGRWEGRPAAERLAGELLGPVFAVLPDSIEHLIIIPDGLLFHLPFETLTPPSDHIRPKGAFLIENYDVSYGLSCSSLLYLFERRPETQVKRFLGFGNPVDRRNKTIQRREAILVPRLIREIFEKEGGRMTPLRKSAAEIKKIARLFPPGKADLFVKDKASEKTVKTLPLTNYETIHFACHGYQDDRIPFRSGLFLSTTGEKSEDGYLRADEIARLRLEAEMVVLSACRSGVGYLEKGEGPMGLPRALFLAGARSVISSLWQVGDRASAEFMLDFYQNLSRKMNKTQALRAAKLKMLGSPYAHPFYWASFILYGEPFSGLSFDAKTSNASGPSVSQAEFPE